MAGINPSGMYRISGLASGMDIDGIVKDLMNAHRMRLDSVEQDKQIWQWRQEDYRSINTALLNMRNAVFDLKLQGSFMLKKAESSSGAVTAEAGATALDAVHTVEVSSLARGALIASESEVETTGAYTAPLSEMLEGLAVDEDGKITVEIGDGISSEVFTLDADTQSLKNLIEQINKSELNVQASWDNNLNRFYLASTKLGAENGVSCKDQGGNLMAILCSASSTEGKQVSGTDAQVSIDGIDYTFDSNQFKVNGVTYNLKGTTTKTNPADITISHDVDTVFNNIKDFVAKYNIILDALNGKLSEERYTDHKPLTDEQVSSGELTDKQLDQWQEKARSGLLRGDTLLERAATSMRTALSSVVVGLTGVVTVSNGSERITTTANQLSVIGITTGSYQDKGKLYINETRLREALQSNPEAVMELFTKSRDASGNEITDSSKQGLAVQLYEGIDGAISLLTDRAGSGSSLYDDSYISKKVRNIDENISKMEDHLQVLEARYYRQFTAMEMAIARMNTQSMWLTQQFSGS
ncbi:MAG: flagellar filament capping protein FliD [Syntrophaceticus sp.]|nr:flagellar filament capping protein FliD [Syntrophaceticus sp.]MDD4360263.1 flagellar filament capping protein FliD [Syntrophaceticus sp.]MDD4783677.1 flagellar filament capping protein FliD [Syntrophaceticus sp.]